MPRVLQRRPFVLVVRDGWGSNPHPEWNHANAVYLAKKPIDDKLMAEYPHVLIHTSGENVGLPAGIMGNSEVGHQNIGAGRVVDQEILRISRRIQDGSFFANEALRGAYEFARRHNGSVHIMGLCSDAGVHSALEHLYACVELGKRLGFPGERIFVHAFGDGRDSPPQSGIDFIRQVEAKLAAIGAGRVASVIGRYYAMDRDNRWDRVAAAYRMLTRGEGHRVGGAVEAFQRYYEHATEPSRAGDEFIEATVIVPPGSDGPAIVHDGDGVIFFNFRGDRPRELTKAFVLDDAAWQGLGARNDKSLGFDRGRKLDLYYATMTAYEEGLPVHVAFAKPPKLKNIFGSYLSDLGLRQFRCAETEKYPHVTFFFNDYRDEPFPGEERLLVPSPRDVSTYDQKPEMSAEPVTDEVVARIKSGEYDAIIVNYANGDMVGHTGNLKAAIAAVECVDGCVGRLVDATLAAGGALIVTADHGNCEQMIDPATGGPHTAHTTYDVELIVIDPRQRGKKLRTGGRLADVIPTGLALMGLSQPGEMTGQRLL
ncbi:MAG TPA: 2,3-bisphosphoglycerate-independent phosphoglycerate mutase [Phycisphaerae bacterium]